MKKLLTTLLALQLVWILTGCCCPCAKKALEQKPQTQEKPAEQTETK